MVIPAELASEFVPDPFLYFVRPQSALETPLGDFLVRATRADAFAKLVEPDAKKPAQVSVETDAQAEIRAVFLGKLSEMVQADFVEQTGEVAEPAYAFARAAEGGIEHGVGDFLVSEPNTH